MGDLSVRLRRRLRPGEIARIRKAPPRSELSDKALAAELGVSARTITYWRTPGGRMRTRKMTRCRNRAKRAHKVFDPEFLKVPYGPRAKPQQDKYERMLREALDQGVPLGKVQNKIAQNLARLIEQQAALARDIKECRKAQETLYKLFDMEAFVPPDVKPFTAYTGRKVYMTADEFRRIMREQNLSIARLALNLAGRYSRRAIRAYRQAESRVPKELAEYMRGIDTNPVEGYTLC